MTITYKVKNGIYVNMTNRCPCACTFCLRQNGPGVFGSDSLWLEHEPSVDEVKASIDSWDLEKYDEVVFCGYGEPTERLPELLEVAAYIRSKSDIKIRINTNGLADLIWNRPTEADLEGLIDTVSISLNANNAEDYLKLTRSKSEADPLEIRYRVMAGYARLCEGVHEVCSEGRYDGCRQSHDAEGAGGVEANLRVTRGDSACETV